VTLHVDFSNGIESVIVPWLAMKPVLQQTLTLSASKKIVPACAGILAGVRWLKIAVTLFRSVVGSCPSASNNRAFFSRHPGAMAI
jgi:hypothetical protein